MNIDFLTIMAYLIVVITLMTMIFGIIAYVVYKMREARRAKVKESTSAAKEAQIAARKQYLFFEEKEIVL